MLSKTKGLIHHRQREKTKVASFVALFYINKLKRRALFTKSYKKNLCLQNQLKQKEKKTFVYEINMQKQKRRASFTKPALTKINKELYLQNQHKRRKRKKRKNTKFT